MRCLATAALTGALLTAAPLAVGTEEGPLETAPASGGRTASVLANTEQGDGGPSPTSVPILTAHLT